VYICFIIPNQYCQIKYNKLNSFHNTFFLIYVYLYQLLKLFSKHSFVQFRNVGKYFVTANYSRPGHRPKYFTCVVYSAVKSQRSSGKASAGEPKGHGFKSHKNFLGTPKNEQRSLIWLLRPRCNFWKTKFIFIHSFILVFVSKTAECVETLGRPCAGPRGSDAESGKGGPEKPRRENSCRQFEDGHRTLRHAVRCSAPNGQWSASPPHAFKYN